MNNTKAVLPSYPTYPSLEPIVREIQKRSFPENRSVENPKEALTHNRAEEHHQEVSFGETFQKIESHAEKCASAESLIESYEAANFDQKLRILNKLFSILIEDIDNYGLRYPWHTLETYKTSRYILNNIPNLCEDLINNANTLGPDQEIAGDVMVFVLFFLNFITYFKKTILQRKVDSENKLLDLAIEQFFKLLVVKKYLIEYN